MISWLSPNYLICPDLIQLYKIKKKIMNRNKWIKTNKILTIAAAVTAVQM